MDINDPGGVARDVADDTVTMTFDEIAKAKGLKRRSAVRWVQRHKLRRTLGNADGKTRVTVPLSLLTSQGDDARAIADDVAPASVHESHPVAPAAARDIAGLVAGLGAAIAGLRDALKAAEARAERADARADALAQERDQARLERDRAIAARQAHEGRADALEREIEAAKAAGLPRRVWRALRGR